MGAPLPSVRPSTTSSSQAHLTHRMVQTVMCATDACGRSGKNSRHVGFDAELALPLHGGEQAVYELQSVIVHSGASVSNGHYICFARTTDQEWHEANDEKVTRATWQTVRASEAYVLVYRRTTTTASNCVEGRGQADRGSCLPLQPLSPSSSSISPSTPSSCCSSSLSSTPSSSSSSNLRVATNDDDDSVVELDLQLDDEKDQEGEGGMGWTQVERKKVGRADRNAAAPHTPPPPPPPKATNKR
eukprot:57025-Eustigmatos_ZCMA.PRE.1